MENRQDYLDSQVDILTKVLRKLLEKLLKVKSADINENPIQDIVTSEISLKETLNINGLTDVNETELVSLLTEKYQYSTESLKLLGDIFYDLYNLDNNLVFAKKALILYNHVVASTGKNLDFSVFGRQQELRGLIH